MKNKKISSHKPTKKINIFNLIEDPYPQISLQNIYHQIHITKITDKKDKAFPEILTAEILIVIEIIQDLLLTIKN